MRNVSFWGAMQILVTSVDLSIFGRPFVKRFALCYGTVVCPVCLTACPVCDVGVLWPNGWMDQGETWHASRTRPRPHCARWGPSSPSLKKGQPPIFGPLLLWPNGWMDQDATWYEGGPSDHATLYYMGTKLTPKGTQPPIFG